MKSKQFSGDIIALSQQQNFHHPVSVAQPKLPLKKIKPILCAIAAVAGFCTVSAAWATGSSPATAAVTQQASATQADNPQVQQINSYIREVEKNVSSYKRNEEKLSPEQLTEVTDKKWSKIHTYTDGDQLKRMKLYPSDGSQRTEEFYYKDGNLVFAFLEENG